MAEIDLRQNESALIGRDDGTHWSGWLAAAVVVVAFSLSHGLSGVVAGLATAVIWAVLGTPAAVAAGTVLLIAQTPEGVDPLGGVVVAGGLLALVLAPAATARYPTGYAAVVVLTTAVLGALAWFVIGALALWLTTLALATTGVVAVYGLHRYLRLRLGMLGPPADTDGSSTDGRS